MFFSFSKYFDTTAERVNFSELQDKVLHNAYITGTGVLYTYWDSEVQTGLYADDFNEDYKLLNAEVRKHGVNIPPLVNSYMSLSPTMKMFGGGINHEFSEAEETCILIAYDEIYQEKIERHSDSFIQEKYEKIERRFPRFVANMGDGLRDMLAKRREARQRKAELKAEKKQQKKSVRQAKKANRKNKKNQQK